MRGLTVFQKPSYREISPMWGRPMRHIDLILKKKSIFWKLIRNTMIRREMKKKISLPA